MPSNTPTRYRVDFERLVWLLLPALLRRPRQVAWLRALTAPVRTLYNQFVAYEAQTRRELSYNSQVLLFELYLNDKFDPGRRRIYIENADTALQPVYLTFLDEEQENPMVHFKGENMPWLYLYLYHQVVFNTQTDFTVHAPASLQSQAGQLHAAISRLKLATRNYQLLFFA